MILFRYILRELIAPFLLSVAVLTSLLVIFQSLRLIDLVINRGLSLESIGKIFLFTLPTFFVLTIPMAVLIASISAFNRFSSDNEDIAMKGTGVGYTRMAVPVLFASLGVLVLTLPLSITAKPWAGRSLKNLALDLAQKEASIALEEGVFNDVFENLVIYVESMPTHRDLQGILIADSRDPNQPKVIIAKRGSLFHLEGQRKLSLRLENGAVEVGRGSGDTFREVTFSSYQLTLDLDTALKRIVVSPDDQLDLESLRRKIKTARDPDNKYNRLLTQAYKNYLFPWATPVFAIIGMPLGLYSRRSGRLGGFAIGIGVIAGFYLFSVMGDFAVGARIGTPLAGALFPLVALAGLSWGIWTAYLRGFSLDHAVGQLLHAVRLGFRKGER